MPSFQAVVSVSVIAFSLLFSGETETGETDGETETGETDGETGETDGETETGDDGETGDDEVETLKAQLDAANSKIDTVRAESRADAAEDELDKVKSGKLIRWGVTGGVGPAFHVPLHHAHDGNGRPMIAPSLPSAISYVMFHPAYWKDTPQQNIYCANLYTRASNEAASQRLADESALKRAEVRMELLLHVLTVHDVASNLLADHVSDTDQKLVGSLVTLDRNLALLESDHGSKTLGALGDISKPRKSRAAARDAKAILDRITDSRSSDVKSDIVAEITDATTVTDARGKISILLAKYDIWRYPELAGITADQVTLAQSIIKSTNGKVMHHNVEMSVEDAKHTLASTMRGTVVGWMIDKPAVCKNHKYIGFWVGYPVPFKVTVPIRSGAQDELSRVEVNVKNSIAFGYGISPNAYVSVLTGFTFGTVNLSPQDNDREFVATWMIGIGGNLDIFTLLRGG